MKSYLRIIVGLDEDDFQMILKQYNSNFVIYEILPGIYSIEVTSKVVYTMCDHRGALQIEYDDISMKTKILLNRFGSTFGTLRFDETSFLKTLLGFTPFRDFKTTNAVHSDNPGVFDEDKTLNSSTIAKIHLKCDVIDGSIVNGKREPILFSSVLDK